MYEPIPNFTDLGSGLIAAIEAAGIGFRLRNHIAEATDVAGATAIMQAFDPLPWEKEQALARLAAKRWAVMTGGTTVGGVAVKTDADGIASLTGAFNLAAAGVQNEFRFKVGAGEFQTLTADQMKGLFAAVAGFIQACYDNEKALSDQIAAVTDWKEARVFDVTQGWPA